MVAIAIVSTDPVLRRDLAQVLRGEPMITAVSVIDDPDAVVADQDQLGVILVDALSPTQVADLRIQDGKIFIIAGRRTFSKPARNGWLAIRRGPQPRTR
jgi:hypothetical protein